MATIPVYGKITPKEDRATSIYEANDTMKMLGYAATRRCKEF